MANFLTVLVLFTLFSTSFCLDYTNQIYQWTKGSESYQSKGKWLVGHWFFMSWLNMTSQCAYQCLKVPVCQSFNFDSTDGKCELNRKTHLDNPSDFLDDVISREYHTREAYSIDEEALGPCGGDPCNGKGMCLETRTEADGLVALCICDKGWAGVKCDLVDAPQWGVWEPWGACSVSCGQGWHTRKRNCEDSVNNNTIDPLNCYGRNVEYEACMTSACPKWDNWGAWDVCSTETSCGRGNKIRHRTCTNGGTPGVDRLCMGLTNQSASCMDIDCKGLMRLKGGTQQGEGRVEIFNDLNKEWGLVCSDQWNMFAANLVCKQMGLPGAFDAVTDGSFGNGAGKYGITSLTCTGSERTVQMCKRNPWALSTSCSSTSSAAGVKCNVNGVWSLWGSWSSCSVTCADGIEERTRQCNHPPALHGGKPCPGDALQTRPCALPACPIDGVWAMWESWLACSETCGQGTHGRKRVCIGPYHGGDQCPGNHSQTEVCQDIECPADGVWGLWQTWGNCSVTCGGGQQTRQRKCIKPSAASKDCIGKATEVSVCSTNPCPIDGYWRDWAEWDPCNVTCGGGQQRRERVCVEPQYGGNACNGSAFEWRECNTNNCPVNGHWMDWGQWSTCKVSCGGGIETRSRECYQGKNGGKDCIDGLPEETRECNTHTCAVDGVWNLWGEWNICTLTCGNGNQTRTRTCHGPFSGGTDCDGITIDTRHCNTQHCPVYGIWESSILWSGSDLAYDRGIHVRDSEQGSALWAGTGHVLWLELVHCFLLPSTVDGVWDAWSDWDVCSLTCGGGIQWRTRNCTGPFYGGHDCAGSEMETRHCNTHPCPVNGYFNEWAPWSDCDVTCNGGIRWRNRTCIGPMHGGKDCEGSRNETETCNTHNCPVDGFFADWSVWGDCSVSCGGGVRRRTRTCIGPFYQGAACLGPRNDSTSCNEYHCPVDGVYSDWSSWSTCTVTCGGGTQWHNRTCIGPFYDGDHCQGLANATQACNTQHCPVDGFYSDWSKWGTCSVTCGGGTRSRNRTCTEPQYGGQDCRGPADDWLICNTHHCPVNGFWYSWSNWGTCNTTCGGGSRERTRVCESPKYDGDDCVGHSAEYLICNENPCPIPGDWFPWVRWTTCPVTCGGGKRRRHRTCNMDSYGDLTAPCLGDEKQIDDCHTYPCTPYASTCAEWGKLGLMFTTMADIDPFRRPVGQQEAVRVYCDMESENGIGITVIGHHQEEEHEVKGYEGAGEFELEIEYNVTLEQAIAIIDNSKSCKQFISWKCKAALIHNPNGLGSDSITTGWKNRTGKTSDYFGGGSPGSGNCECGMTKSCADAALACNCDMNDATWREDSGFLTYKDDLPVVEFIAGDTGGTNEAGFGQIGALFCWGIADNLS